MRINRYCMTPDEDTTKYHVEQGSLLLRGLADRVSEIFCAGRPLAEHELRTIQKELHQIWRIVVSETLDGIAPSEGVVDEDTLADYHGWYSDQTPVVDSGDVFDKAIRGLPDRFRERHITPHTWGVNEGVYTWSKDSEADSKLWAPPHERPCRAGHHDEGGDAGQEVAAGRNGIGIPV